MNSTNFRNLTPFLIRFVLVASSHSGKSEIDQNCKNVSNFLRKINNTNQQWKNPYPSRAECCLLSRRRECNPGELLILKHQ